MDCLPPKEKKIFLFSMVFFSQFNFFFSFIRMNAGRERIGYSPPEIYVSNLEVSNLPKYARTLTITRCSQRRKSDREMFLNFVRRKDAKISNLKDVVT